MASSASVVPRGELLRVTYAPALSAPARLQLERGIREALGTVSSASAAGVPQNGVGAGAAADAVASGGAAGADSDSDDGDTTAASGATTRNCVRYLGGAGWCLDTQGLGPASGSVDPSVAHSGWVPVFTRWHSIPLPDASRP